MGKPVPTSFVLTEVIMFPLSNLAVKSWTGKPLGKNRWRHVFYNKGESTRVTYFWGWFCNCQNTTKPLAREVGRGKEKKKSSSDLSLSLQNWLSRLLTLLMREKRRNGVVTSRCVSEDILFVGSPKSCNCSTRSVSEFEFLLSLLMVVGYSTSKHRISYKIWIGFFEFSSNCAILVHGLGIDFEFTQLE